MAKRWEMEFGGIEGKAGKVEGMGGGLRGMPKTFYDEIPRFSN